jgi:hypothetical protein
LKGNHLRGVVGLDVLHALDEHLMRFAPKLETRGRYVEILTSAAADDILQRAGR